METNNRIYSLVRKTFIKAVNTLAENYHGTSFTDIFITVDKESGEVSFFDDEENCIETVVIENWIDQPDLSDEKIISTLRVIAEELDNEGILDTLEIYKPFSVNYADECMVSIEEILFINDNTSIQADNDLLEKFDREFDDFLDKLLKE